MKATYTLTLLILIVIAIISCNNNSHNNKSSLKEDSLKSIQLIKGHISKKDKITIDSFRILEIEHATQLLDSLDVQLALQTTLASVNLIDSVNMQVYRTKKYASLNEKEKSYIEQINNRINFIDSLRQNSLLDSSTKNNGYYITYAFKGADSNNAEITGYDQKKLNNDLRFIKKYAAKDEYPFKELQGVEY